MPIRTQKVKMETRVDKVGSSNGNSRLKSTELSECGNSKDDRNASLVSILSDSQSRRDSTLPKAEKSKVVVEGVNPHIQWIPVIAKTGKPLMPTRPKRARELLKSGKAVGKWKVGIFYIQLTQREDGTAPLRARQTAADPSPTTSAKTTASAPRCAAHTASETRKPSLASSPLHKSSLSENIHAAYTTTSLRNLRQ